MMTDKHIYLPPINMLPLPAKWQLIYAVVKEAASSANDWSHYIVNTLIIIIIINIIAGRTIKENRRVELIFQPVH